MQKILVLILLCFIGSLCNAQSDSIQARIVLIGDAGELNYSREPVVDAARNIIPMDENTTVIYLGDNIYNSGLPSELTPEYKQYKDILDSQINIARGTKAKVIFIPGNHDWNNEASDGLERVKRQEEYINNLGNKNIMFYPKGGCPGPFEYDSINKNILLVIYDSQWFIRTLDEKPGIQSECSSKTEDQFYSELQDIIARNPNKFIILASHHTLKSYGIHGGFYKLKQYIFPLTDLKPYLYFPIPFLYIIVRGVFGTPEDLHYPAYKNLIDRVETITKGHPNILFVAGHEHTLQLIKDSSHYYIVSGGGSKSTRVNRSKKTDYVAQSLGFAALEISKNDNVRVKFYEVGKDSVHLGHSQNLFNFSAIIERAEDSSNIATTTPIDQNKDSVTVPINSSYNTISGVHKIFAGENYRREWAAPVNFKVFRIRTQNGGFTIKYSGGGKQTESLHLSDKYQREWVLRTVDKDPGGSIPEVLKPYVAPRIMRDMITAEHPYGALMVPLLEDAAQVEHAEPAYFYIPDDPAFGIYREKFKKRVCLLELQAPTADATRTKKTSEVIDRLITDSKNHVDQQILLRARLIDMLIGDWDRHFDQWRFGSIDTGVGKLYYPIPRDRDQAFFYSDGLFVKGLSIAALPYLQGFRKTYRNIKWFNWEERDFDRFFMNNLDRDAWKRVIGTFQADVNDTVIHDAVKRLPPAIYLLDSAIITSKLISRRDRIMKSGLKYYKFLSKEVNVVGSNKDEYFKVSNLNGGLEVKVFKREKDLDSSDVMFDRVFYRSSTKYINLYGLNGADKFDIDNSANSKIRLRIIGGEGRDTFDINGNVRNVIYDFKPDSNVILHISRTKNAISSDPTVNQYEVVGFNYNSYRIPILSVGYNYEDGLNAGIGYSLKTYFFRKEPFSTYQAITSLYNFNSGKYQVNYNGEFNHLISNYDIVGKGSLYNSVLNNFFGYGNNTTIDKTKNINFYKVRYNYLSADLVLRKRFHKLAELLFGPTYYHYWNNLYDNKDKVLSQPRTFGLDSADVYTNKTYLGGKAQIIIHTTNSDFLPTRGAYWTTELSTLVGMTDGTHTITKITSDLVLNASFNDPARFVAVIKFGYGHIFNKNYEYFQALNLGDNNYLRGFRKDRFSGRSAMYQSSEARYKLFDSKSYIVPGAVGLLIFNDIGRVWTPDVLSHKWHDSYGGGLYYSFYNFGIVSATLAISSESSLFNFSIGTKFNITY